MAIMATMARSSMPMVLERTMALCSRAAMSSGQAYIYSGRRSFSRELFLQPVCGSPKAWLYVSSFLSPAPASSVAVSSKITGRCCCTIAMHSSEMYFSVLQEEWQAFGGGL